MSRVVVVFGAIGSGKTTTCLDLVEKARSEVKVAGIITRRVLDGEEVTGYDCVDVGTGESFPLVRLAEDMDDPDWLPLYLEKFVFSTSGFIRANDVLRGSVAGPEGRRLIVVDEFGRLEARGEGFVEGVEAVLGGSRGHDVVVVTCRTNLLGIVEEMAARAGHEVNVCGPGGPDELWEWMKV